MAKENDKTAMLRGVAQFLLQQQYLLTAFELLQEILESGNEQGVEELNEFFQNSERFPASTLELSRHGLENGSVNGEQLATQNQGFALESARTVKEKVQALEAMERRAQEAERKAQAMMLELEREKQRTRVLQQQQQQQQQRQQQHQKQHQDKSTEGGETRAFKEGEADHRETDSSSTPAAPADAFSIPHLLSAEPEAARELTLGEMESEERAELNWAVREYLAHAGYKVTAMTLCDEEADQDWAEPPQGMRAQQMLAQSDSSPAGPLLRRMLFEVAHRVASGASKQKLTEREQELAGAREALTAAQAELRQAVQAHSSEVDQLRRELERTQTAWRLEEQLKQEANSCIAKLERKIEDLLEEQKKLKERAVEEEQKNSSVQKVLKQLKADLEARVQEKAVLEQEMGALRGQLAVALERAAVAAAETDKAVAAARAVQPLLTKVAAAETGNNSADSAAVADVVAATDVAADVDSAAVADVAASADSAAAPDSAPEAEHTPALECRIHQRQLAELLQQVEQLQGLLEKERAHSASRKVPPTEAPEGVTNKGSVVLDATNKEEEKKPASSPAVLQDTDAMRDPPAGHQQPQQQQQQQQHEQGGVDLASKAVDFVPSEVSPEESSLQGSSGGGQEDEELCPREKMSKGELRAVQLISERLPRIAPNVLINHREELLPLILYAVERNPVREERRALIHGLLNLIKKPDEEQRAYIVAACAELVPRIGAQAVEAEVLSLCWDELSHRNEEKRLLVSQLCPGLAPHIPTGMREGVLLSLMLKAAEDPAAIVREAAALHLSQLLPLLEDITVYPQVEKAVFGLVCDSDGVVVDEALQSLVPAFVSWSISRKHPFGQVLRAVLGRTKGEIEKCPPLLPPSAAAAKRPEANMRNLGERERWNFGVLLRMLTGLMVEVRHVAFCTCPAQLKSTEEGGQGTGAQTETGEVDSTGKGSIPSSESAEGVKGNGDPTAPTQGVGRGAEDEETGFLTESPLKRYASASFAWPAFDWLALDCLPTLIHLSLMVHPKEDDVRFRMCTFLLEVGSVFGPHFLMLVVLPMFLTSVGHSLDLSSLHSNAREKVASLKPEGPASERAAKMCVLPLLLGGVLGSPLMKEGHLKRYLKEWVAATCGKVGAWSASSTPELIDCVRFLCNKFEEHRETVCAVLWDLVVNTSPPVRATAAVLFGAMAETCEPKRVHQQILPALVTLGADPLPEVKTAAIGAFGRILKQFKDDAVVSKVREQMDLFLEDGSHETSVAVLKALVPAVPVTTSAMREYLLQKVFSLATSPQTSAMNIATRLDKTDALCLAIRALEHTELSPAAMSNLFLPSVQALLKDPDALEPGNKEALEAILKDRWSGSFGTFGKAMGKTFGMIAQSPQRAPTGGAAGGGGLSSFAMAFGGSTGEQSGMSSWGIDFGASSEDKHGQKSSRAKLFK